VFRQALAREGVVFARLFRVVEHPLVGARDLVVEAARARRFRFLSELELALAHELASVLAAGAGLPLFVEHQGFRVADELGRLRVERRRIASKRRNGRRENRGGAHGNDRGRRHDGCRRLGRGLRHGRPPRAIRRRRRRWSAPGTERRGPFCAASAAGWWRRNGTRLRTRRTGSGRRRRRSSRPRRPGRHGPRLGDAAGSRRRRGRRYRRRRMFSGAHDTWRPR
jgi:hypothetical protein